MKYEPEVLFNGLACQLCVPAGWTDEQVLTFAPVCGTVNGWQIRRKGDKALLDDPERNPCAKREGFVHIVLDA